MNQITDNYIKWMCITHLEYHCIRIILQNGRILRIPLSDTQRNKETHNKTNKIRKWMQPKTIVKVGEH